MSPGTRPVQTRAQKLANARMQKEILPLLDEHDDPTLAKLWNPLVPAEGPYGMKLKLPDKLVIEILRSDTLLDATATIVIESTYDAMLDEPQAFVTSILNDLISR